MENASNLKQDQLLTSWLSLTSIQMQIANELEVHLLDKHQLQLKEFYLLLFLSEAPEKKLKLHQLESLVGLSQSAVSRLVSRFEAKECGALRRHACNDDRRSIYTQLTAEGEQKLNQAQATFREVLVQALPEKEIQSLLHELLQWKRNG